MGECPTCSAQRLPGEPCTWGDFFKSRGAYAPLKALLIFRCACGDKIHDIQLQLITYQEAPRHP